MLVSSDTLYLAPRLRLVAFEADDQPMVIPVSRSRLT